MGAKPSESLLAQGKGQDTSSQCHRGLGFPLLRKAHTSSKAHVGSTSTNVGPPQPGLSCTAGSACRPHTVMSGLPLVPACNVSPCPAAM